MIPKSGTGFLQNRFKFFLGRGREFSERCDAVGLQQFFNLGADALDPLEVVALAGGFLFGSRFTGCLLYTSDAADE